MTGSLWKSRFSSLMKRLFDNLQVIAYTNLELPGILSYCIWMWLGKSVLSRALASPKKQLESLSISSLIHIPNQSTQLKLNDTYIEPAKQIKTTQPNAYEEDEDDNQDQ
ncbi:hypothetical protein YC2023_116037 [Brassica napus]